MEDIGSRLAGITPLAWILILLAAVAGFGAKPLARLFRVPEERQMKAMVVLKSISLLLAVGGMVLVLLST